MEGFRRLPRPVVVRQFQRIQQVAAGGGRGIGQQGAPVGVFAHGQRRPARIELVDQADVRGAGGREIAFVGVVRALAVMHAADHFRHHEIEVRVTLAVRVRAHVDRHAVDEGGEVGAVVQVEAAQEVLVGLAVAAVLGDDHARHEFQDFAGPQRRPAGDQRGRDGAFAGGIRRADAVVVMGRHADGRRLGCRVVGRCFGVCEGVRGGAQRPREDRCVFHDGWWLGSRIHLPVGATGQCAHLATRAPRVWPVSGLASRTVPPSHAGRAQWRSRQPVVRGRRLLTVAGAAHPGLPVRPARPCVSRLTARATARGHQTGAIIRRAPRTSGHTAYWPPCAG